MMVSRELRRIIQLSVNLHLNENIQKPSLRDFVQCSLTYTRKHVQHAGHNFHLLIKVMHYSTRQKSQKPQMQFTFIMSHDFDLLPFVRCECEGRRLHRILTLCPGGWDHVCCALNQREGTPWLRKRTLLWWMKLLCFIKKKLKITAFENWKKYFREGQ